MPVAVYEKYELPPGPDGFANYAFIPNDLVYKNRTRRRSWQDMVDQQSQSDSGSFNSSYSTVPINDRSDLNDKKRRSWGHLVESDENLQKHDKLIVSALPEPPGSQPISFMTVKDGQLGRVQLFQKRKNPSTSSKASTISEFILVPKSLSMESVAEVFKPNKAYESESKTNSTVCHWSARKATFAVIATLGLCVFVGLIGYLVRTYLELNEVNYSLNLLNAKDLFYYNLNVTFGKNWVVINSNTTNAVPMKSTKTVLDFKNVDRRAEWRENWNYQLSAVDARTKDAILNSDYQEICGSTQNIVILLDSASSQKDYQCNNCFKTCLPKYGFKTDLDQTQIFTILEEQCFWFSHSGLPTLWATSTTLSNKLLADNFIFHQQQQLWQQPQQPQIYQLAQRPFQQFQNTLFGR